MCINAASTLALLISSPTPGGKSPLFKPGGLAIFGTFSSALHKIRRRIFHLGFGLMPGLEEELPECGVLLRHAVWLCCAHRWLYGSEVACPLFKASSGRARGRGMMRKCRIQLGTQLFKLLWSKIAQSSGQTNPQGGVEMARPKQIASQSFHLTDGWCHSVLMTKMRNSPPSRQSIERCKFQSRKIDPYTETARLKAKPGYLLEPSSTKHVLAKEGRRIWACMNRVGCVDGDARNATRRNSNLQSAARQPGDHKCFQHQHVQIALVTMLQLQQAFRCCWLK
ncbi:hypothetical protein IWZ03DRAFT_233470 [Phyllosticta citriasiana]|uniref:Uncharacterized protein n=1 Tax=Phyllosticta citriasiana TaxID=595635 RepID=A0ABR1KHQ7_9PEZI